MRTTPFNMRKSVVAGQEIVLRMYFRTERRDGSCELQLANRNLRSNDPVTTQNECNLLIDQKSMDSLALMTRPGEQHSQIRTGNGRDSLIILD